jgi:hypothetical protein
MLYGHENVSPSQKFVHIVYYPFQMMSNINKCTIGIQDIRNIFKRKATWDEPIEKAQP